MTNNNRELDAFNAYLRFLEGKGATADNLAQRRALLLNLLPLLESQPMDGNAYRDQTECVLDLLERTAWPAFLTVAREYYYFWASDIKSIAAMHSGGGYDIAGLHDHVPLENLRTLWKSIDQEKFELAETWPLKAYASALRDEGAEKSVVETRIKLVKLLLVRLRGAAAKEANLYRKAVDTTLPLFAMRETRLLFQIVVREFYYFWIGDPEAASHLVLDAQQEQT
jgi:hypothetical protein